MDPKSNGQANRVQKVIQQLEESVRRCMEEISVSLINQFHKQLTNIMLQRLDKAIQQITSIKLVIQSRESPQTTTNNQLTTPKKHLTSYSKHITFGFTSQVKTQQDFQSLASANDQLYKQCEDMLDKYRYNKQTLNHENQIVLNQWLQHTNHISSATDLNKNHKKSTFFSLVKSLIQELSKYESVEEYISTVQQIQHQKIVNQLRVTSMEAGDDGEKKWLKETTKDYFLKMAELLKKRDDNTADEEEIEDICEEELENMF